MSDKSTKRKPKLRAKAENERDELLNAAQQVLGEPSAWHSLRHLKYLVERIERELTK